MPRIESGGQGHDLLVVHIGRHRAEIYVQVLELSGPIAAEPSFDPAADRPASIDCDVLE